MKIATKTFIFLIITLFFFTNNASFAKKAAIIIDYNTKNVLFEVNADTPNYPASLTKIMTLLTCSDTSLKFSL